MRGVGIEKISNAVWDELFALPYMVFLDVSENALLDFVPPVDSIYRFQVLNCFSLKGTDISRLQPDSLANFRTALDAFDISYPSVAVSERVDMTPIFTGLTNVRATMWYSNVCPAGFYSTPLNHGNVPAGLCIRCPPGTVKLESGGPPQAWACTACDEGTFDHDEDATTPCVPHLFQVANFNRISMSSGDAGEESVGVTGCEDIAYSPCVVQITATVSSPQALLTQEQSANSTVVLHRIILADADVSNTNTAVSEMTYGFSFTGNATAVPEQSANSGFLINPQNGYISGRSSTSGQFTLNVYVADKNGQLVVLQRVEFDFKESDTALYSNGPGGADCAHPDQRYDAVLLDGNFACDCNLGATAGKFVGVRCSEKAPLTTTSIALIGTFVPLLVIAAIVVGVFASFKAKREQVRRKPVDFNAAFELLVANGDIGTEAESRPVLEIERRNVKLISVIGEGAFGQVWKGTFQSSGSRRGSGAAGEFIVAIKVAKLTTEVGQQEGDNPAARELIREATIMSAVGQHPNVVCIIGAVTILEPKLLLVSFCEHGSLVSVLRKRAENTLTELPDPTFVEYWNITWALEVARGMEHLESRNFVHRDLAARNVLLDGLWTCKVADFGMSRATKSSDARRRSSAFDEEDQYYRPSGSAAQIPVRWTAPEVLTTGRCTSKSDVWSFAVTAMEILTDGKLPYEGMSNAAVMAKVPEGFRMGYPLNARVPDGMYRVLEDCWFERPLQRPSFARIADQLEELQNGTVGPQVQASLTAAGLQSPAPAVAPRGGMASGGGGGAAAHRRSVSGSTSVGKSGDEYEYVRHSLHDSGGMDGQRLSELLLGAPEHQYTLPSGETDHRPGKQSMPSNGGRSSGGAVRQRSSANSVAAFQSFITLDTTVATQASANADYVTVSPMAENAPANAIPPPARPRLRTSEPIFAISRPGAAGPLRQRSSSDGNLSFAEALVSDQSSANPNPYMHLVKTDAGDEYMISEV